MAGRKQSTFKKRQKEQQRKERREEKFAKRMQRKHSPHPDGTSDESMDAMPDDDASSLDVSGEDAGGQQAAAVEGRL
jgi:hypothetical protein